MHLCQVLEPAAGGLLSSVGAHVVVASQGEPYIPPALSVLHHRPPAGQVAATDAHFWHRSNRLVASQHRLQTKLPRSSAAGHSSARLPAESPLACPHLLYMSQWRASLAVRHTAEGWPDRINAPSIRPPLTLKAGAARFSVCLIGSVKPLSGLAVAQLEVLQGILSGSTDAGMHGVIMQTSGGLISPSDAPSGRSGWPRGTWAGVPSACAMLRVAAAELREMQWSEYGAHANDPPERCGASLPHDDAALPRSNAFGAASAGGAWLRPWLLKSMDAAMPNRPPATVAVDLSGSIVVSGGLGDLGLLVAAWLASDGTR
jgi:hypothetical protein